MIKQLGVLPVNRFDPRCQAPRESSADPLSVIVFIVDMPEKYPPRQRRRTVSAGNHSTSWREFVSSGDILDIRPVALVFAKNVVTEPVTQITY